MWPEPDGKHLLHRSNIFVALRWQGRGGFAQSGIERGLDFSSLQWFQKIAAEEQRHELRGGKPERGNVAEAFNESPARLAVMALHYQREADCFQRFEIAPNRAGVFRIIMRNRFDKFLQSQAVRAFEPAQ